MSKRILANDQKGLLLPYRYLWTANIYFQNNFALIYNNGLSLREKAIIFIAERGADEKQAKKS